MRTLTLCLILLGCTNGDANHIGNPLLLPVGAVTTGVENGFYNARRKRVEQYIAANKPALHADVLAGHGPTLTALYKIAKTPVKNQAALARELSRGQTQYFADDPEPMVVAVMVHS
jgi:hypothetical protein